MSGQRHELKERLLRILLHQLEDFGVDVGSSPFIANRFGVLVYKQYKPLIDRAIKQAELRGRIEEIKSMCIYKNELAAETIIVFGDHFGVSSAEQRIADLTKQLEEIEK